MSLKRFDFLVSELRRTFAGLPDKRTGTNTQYNMETIGLSAFSVFFTQSPSFLAHQKTIEQDNGQSNAQTLFQDIRALMRYKCFASWSVLMDFMMRGLKIGPYEES